MCSKPAGWHRFLRTYLKKHTNNSGGTKITITTTQHSVSWTPSSRPCPPQRKRKAERKGSHALTWGAQCNHLPVLQRFDLNGYSVFLQNLIHKLHISSLQMFSLIFCSVWNSLVYTINEKNWQWLLLLYIFYMPYMYCATCFKCLHKWAFYSVLAVHLSKCLDPVYQARWQAHNAPSPESCNGPFVLD